MITRFPKKELTEAILSVNPKIRLTFFYKLKETVKTDFTVVYYMFENDEVDFYKCKTYDYLCDYILNSEYEIICVYGNGLPLEYSIVQRVDFH